MPEHPSSTAPEIVVCGELALALHDAIVAALEQADPYSVGCGSCGAVRGSACSPEEAVNGSPARTPHELRVRSAEASASSSAALRVLASTLSSIVATGASHERGEIVALLRSSGHLAEGSDAEWASVSAADLVEAIRTP